MASRYIRYPLSAPHSAVTVYLMSMARTHEEIRLEYFGPIADLVAAGVITPELAAPGGHGRPRQDANGSVRIHRSPRKTRVTMYRPRDIALTMPGVTQGRIDFARFEAERQEQEWQERQAARAAEELESDPTMEAGRRRARLGSVHFNDDRELMLWQASPA